MPHISGRRLHTAAYMLRALSRAGQFAHLPVLALQNDLAYMYKDRARVQERPELHITDAVSDEVYGLWRARAIPKMYSASGCISYFGLRYGILCPLCRYTGGDRGWSGRTVSFFVAPTYLHVQHGKLRWQAIYDDRGRWSGEVSALEDEDGCYAQGILCIHCAKALPLDLNSRDAIAGGLGRLLTRKTFLERAKANRHVWLRFDPVRIGLMGELAKFKHRKNNLNNPNIELPPLRPPVLDDGTYDVMRGVRRHSDETIRKISESNKAAWRRKAGAQS